MHACCCSPNGPCLDLEFPAIPRSEIIIIYSYRDQKVWYKRMRAVQSTQSCVPGRPQDVQMPRGFDRVQMQTHLHTAGCKCKMREKGIGKKASQNARSKLWATTEITRRPATLHEDENQHNRPPMSTRQKCFRGPAYASRLGLLRSLRSRDTCLISFNSR